METNSNDDDLNNLTKPNKFNLSKLTLPLLLSALIFDIVTILILAVF